MSENNIKTVVVVGGGLVGSLCGIFMAKKGFQVTVYEYRDDPRAMKFVKGRSINLALSNRGRRSLAAVGLEEKILQNAIPMKGRMLHDKKSQTKNVPYDPITNQCIYSVGRNYLNQTLITALEKYPNVKIYFRHKLIHANFEDESITVLSLKSQETKICKADLIIGADGAFSSLRRSMQQTPLFEFSQTYIKHGYMELSIPPSKSDKMTPCHLHIWPRGEFMMIALPNKDKSWTVTLFMPFEKFDALNNADKVTTFFRNMFPDALPLIGEKSLIDDFCNTQPSPLVSIKCNPYHVGRKFLLIGDAAHAMVPFYGQGMNAGFEDCTILDEILSKNKFDIELSIREFSLKRTEDAYAICELAMYNYVEMRDLVTTKAYYFRKLLDNILFRIFPNGWVPLYNSVTFSKMNYKRCIEHHKFQNKILRRTITALVFISSIFISYGLYKECTKYI